MQSGGIVLSYRFKVLSFFLCSRKEENHGIEHMVNLVLWNVYLDLSYVTGCISDFSNAVIKYHNRGDLHKEGFIWAYSS